MPIAPQFSDFDRIPRDLLKKEFESNTWQLESKMKMTDKLFINPQVKDSIMSLDTQYIFSSACKEERLRHLDLKFKLSQNRKWKMEVKYPLPCCANCNVKVDATAKDVEVELKGSCADSGVSYTETLSNKSFQSALSYAIAPYCTIGGSVATTFQKWKELCWTVGARCTNTQGMVLSTAFQWPAQSYTAATSIPFTIPTCPISSTLCARVEGTVEEPCGKAELGVIFQLCPNTSLKVKMDKAKNIAACVCAKLTKQLTLGVTAMTPTSEISPKLGVYIKQE